MYLKMFGFTEKPFHITPNPKFIFLSKNHKEAFAHLLYGIQQRVGFLSLTGEVGTGKTTVMRTLLEQLTEDSYRVALVFNPCLSALELLQNIHREFGIDFDRQESNLVILLESLNQFLLRQREEGKTVVLVIDEAQNLAPDVLEQLRLLSNLETETEKLIQMVLVGQPELDEVLERNDLRQLKQRLAVRYRLKPMDETDTLDYIQHRAKVAGWQAGELFTKKGLRKVYHYSSGVPRLINLLCDRALLVAYGQDSRVVTDRAVSAAQRELTQEAPARQSSLLPVALLVACCVAVALVVWFAIRTEQFEPAHARQESQVPAAPETPEAPVATKQKLPQRPDRAAVIALQQAVADLSTDQTALRAITATAELWERPVDSSAAKVRTSRGLLSALQASGLAAAEFQGDGAELLRIDAPAILELVLPNVMGKRFLAIVATEGQRVRLEPALTADGWVGLPELEQIWFGKAFLPYVNPAGIRLIDKPGLKSSSVSALQELLGQLDDSFSGRSGTYDLVTIEAVTRFQRQQKLAPDGRVGAQTLFWLYREAGQAAPRLAQGDR